MPSLHDVVTRWWNGELGGAGAALDIVTAPAEALYHATSDIRNALYDAGAFHATKLPVPVVSIGNLAVGGSGKTPVTAWLARALRDAGAMPAVLHGGYALDEPALHAQMNPDIPVIAGRDRVASGRAAIASGANNLLLDDAFQHRRIARDMDIVLVTAESWITARRILPRGPWREAAASLARADRIVITRRTASRDEAAAVVASVRAAVSSGAGENAGRDVGKNADKTKRVQKYAILSLNASRWERADAASAQPASSAPGTPAFAVTAIATPDAFLANVRSAGATVRDHLYFPDHHDYSASDAAAILRRADASPSHTSTPIVTTAKDWVKLQKLLPHDRVWILAQRVVPESGGAELLSDVQKFVR